MGNVSSTYSPMKIDSLHKVHYLQPGDHIAWNENIGDDDSMSADINIIKYHHHAIVWRKDGCVLEIIQYGKENDSQKKTVHLKSMCVYDGGQMKYDRLFVICYSAKVIRQNPPQIVRKRALQRLGEARYDLIGNNYESFAFYCKTGKPYSSQSDKFLTGLTLGAGTVAAAGLIGLALTRLKREK